MYKKIIILLGLMLPINATGSDLGDIMHQLGEQLLVVLPALYSDDDKHLKSEVTSMTSLLHKAGEHIGTDPGTRVNYQVLLEQLQHATQRTNTSMLKSDLRGAFAICASCHNQDKHFVRNYGISKLKGMDEFLAAEYSFMTRDYPSAVTSYRNYLESDPTDLTKIQVSLDRLLVIGLEIYADPELAANNLGALKKKSKKTSSGIPRPG